MTLFLPGGLLCLLFCLPGFSLAHFRLVGEDGLEHDHSVAAA